MKTKLSGRFWTVLLLFGFMGQAAWVVENMYFNVFIYKIFSATPSDISLMVAASAVSATITTVFMGALSDKIGKRKLMISAGYILWGISILSFAFIRLDFIGKLFPMAASASFIGVALVIVMDCVMTFFGSTANDAAFNAWVTDSTDSTNRGIAEGVNSMMPLVAILAVFGGFMSFNLDEAKSWTLIFTIIGVVVILIGIAGIFLIKEPALQKNEENYFKTVFYGFSPKSVKENRRLYICLLAFILFNISIQIFMPYLIIYYEVSLQMKNYVFVMAPAIILASAVTALWGRVYDKNGFSLSAIISLLWLLLGYFILYFCRSTVPVFIGSLLMMSGYLSGMAVFGAKIRDNTPQGKAGSLQGVRIFSQVLIPGLIGPFIGKTVLADAEVIVGNDGTSGFIPSADIFLAAAIPVMILLVLVSIAAGKKSPNLQKLHTPYETSAVPHSYYPRPAMQRESFVCLNGEWDFEVKRKGKTDYCGKITVPFPPEAELSHVCRITDRHDVLYYRRKICVEELNGRCLVINFGAVDCMTRVLINGECVGENSGGYLPFSFDITSFIKAGENTVELVVRDALDRIYPYGKQKHKRGGMWYTPISGIWQSVWMEYLPKEHIENIRITPSLDSAKIEIFGGCTDKKIITEDGELSFTGNEVLIKPKEIRLWTPEAPNIYEFEIICGEDRVKSYFALREMGVKKEGDRTYLSLNGEPYFFHGLLDQGYFPDGIFTPPSEEGYREDILTAKRLGFNMLRKHIKIEPQIFYYYCDIFGMVVFQDMVNNGRYSFLYDTALPTLGLRSLPKNQSRAVKDIFLTTAEKTVDLLYNHPSVCYYTIFNEGWGQFDSDAVYEHLKPLDETRIWDTASGWFKSEKSDVQSEHIYFKKADFEIGDKPCVLSEFGGYSLCLEGHSFNPDKVYGYKLFKSREELTLALKRLYLDEIIPLIHNGLSACVLTQLTDVEDETNGILTYDRKEIKPDLMAMAEIAAEIKKAVQNGEK